MGILALIISILKIIGIILLIILALILLILIILLFSSIKFETIAKINKEIKFIVNIKYLFGIIKYKYDYEKNESLLKIFGKKINFNEEKELDYELKEDLEDIKKDIEKNIETDIEKIDYNLEKDNYNKSKKKNKEDKYKEKTKKKSNKSKNFDFINILKQIYKDNKDILKIFKKLIERLIKAIKIKKIKIDFEYGLYEPYETGKLCGIISIILPIFPKKYLKKIKLIPNFEEEKFIGDVFIKLKTNLFKILLPILIFILKKPIRKIIFGKGE